MTFQPAQPAMAAQQPRVRGGRVGCSFSAISSTEGRVNHNRDDAGLRESGSCLKHGIQACLKSSQVRRVMDRSISRYQGRPDGRLQFLAVQQCESVTASVMWPGIDKRPKNRGGEARSGTCRRDSITQNKSGLVSNGEVRRELRGLYSYRVEAPETKLPFAGGVETSRTDVGRKAAPIFISIRTLNYRQPYKTGCATAEDNRQVTSPTVFLVNQQYLCQSKRNQPLSPQTARRS